MRFLRADGGIAWVRLSLATVQDANTGAPLRGVAAVQDVTERRAAEERQQRLAREVDHRAKNALAVVQAALRLTPRGDAETFAQAVEGRVAALARAQTLLAGNRWSGAELGELLEGELAAFLGPPPKPGEARPRVSLAGAPLTLGPTAAQALSMAFHELATNAVKYGALGTAEGSLSISWEADRAADSLRLRWVERGGPPVEPAPRRRGFGSRVLEGTVRAQLGGKVERAWQAEGLVVEIMVPLARSLSSGEAPEPGDFAG
jgi:two-component sensor histidine kinase